MQIAWGTVDAELLENGWAPCFSFFWEYSVFQKYLENKAPLFLFFWSHVCNCGNLLFDLALFFDAYKRLKTIYAITSERILIKSTDFQNCLIVIDKEKLPTLDVQTTK